MESSERLSLVQRSLFEFHQCLSLFRVQTEGWRRNQCWRTPWYINNDTVGELQLFWTSRSIWNKHLRSATAASSMSVTDIISKIDRTPRFHQNSIFISRPIGYNKNRHGWFFNSEIQGFIHSRLSTSRGYKFPFFNFCQWFLQKLNEKISNRLKVHDRESDKWMTIDPKPNSFVVNVGKC